MRPRRAALLTPPSPTPAFLQNIAKSCVCHTSDPLPPPPFHFLLLFLLSPRVTRHFQVPSLVVANLPLYFQAVAGCSPRNPFRFMLLHGCRRVGGGKQRRHAPLRTM